MKLRKAIAVVVLMFAALEILPCACLENPTLAPGPAGSFACSIEPFQVCDSGDAFCGAPCFVFSLEVRRFLPDSAAHAPEGFQPAIDHPPQLSA